MKINKKFYDYVESAPFAVQELENGGVVELHSMNQNKPFFDEFAMKGKFVVWTCKDGKNYRLLLEDGYFELTRELYTTRVNQAWTGFWDAFKAKKTKLMLAILLPTFIVSLLFVGFYALIPYIDGLKDNNYVSLACGALMIISFFVGSTIYNRKLDTAYNQLNGDAVARIKNIVGHDHFEELMDAQRVYTDQFFAEHNPKPEFVEEEKQSEEESVEQIENNEETKQEEENKNE